MSYYYSYYIGAMNSETKKIRFLGPLIDPAKPRPCSVLCKSKSFASPLYEEFSPVNRDDLDDATKKLFSYTDADGDDTFETVKYLPFSELPNKGFLTTRYVRVKDLMAYLQNGSRMFEEDEFFCDSMSVESYAVFSQNYFITGKGNKITTYDYDKNEYVDEEVTPKDYMLYSYVNCNSIEYEATLISEAVSQGDYLLHLNKNEKIVILETEG